MIDLFYSSHLYKDALTQYVQFENAVKHKTWNFFYDITTKFFSRIDECFSDEGPQVFLFFSGDQRKRNVDRMLCEYGYYYTDVLQILYGFWKDYFPNLFLWQVNIANRPSSQKKMSQNPFSTTFSCHYNYRVFNLDHYHFLSSTTFIYNNISLS